MDTKLEPSLGIPTTRTTTSRPKPADITHTTIRVGAPRRGHMSRTNREEVRDSVGSTCSITSIVLPASPAGGLHFGGEG